MGGVSYLRCGFQVVPVDVSAPLGGEVVDILGQDGDGATVGSMEVEDLEAAMPGSIVITAKGVTSHSC